MMIMKNLYVISGVTGMTGNELARQLVRMGHKVIHFLRFINTILMIMPRWTA